MEAGYIDTGFGYTTYLVCGAGGGGYDDVGSLGDGEAGGQGSRGGIPGGGDGGTRKFDALTLEGAQGGGSQSGGGGGGGVGRIRFNVVTGLFVPNGGNTVPNLSDAVTTTTRGLASVE